MTLISQVLELPLGGVLAMVASCVLTFTGLVVWMVKRAETRQDTVTDRHMKYIEDREKTVTETNRLYAEAVATNSKAVVEIGKEMHRMTSSHERATAQMVASMAAQTAEVRALTDRLTASPPQNNVLVMPHQPQQEPQQVQDVNP